jgi:hypothetical protein
MKVMQTVDRDLKVAIIHADLDQIIVGQNPQRPEMKVMQTEDQDHNRNVNLDRNKYLSQKA